MINRFKILVSLAVICLIVSPWAPLLQADNFGTLEEVEFISCYDGDTCRFNIPGVHPIIGKNISVRLDGIDTFPGAIAKHSLSVVLGGNPDSFPARIVLRSGSTGYGPHGCTHHSALPLGHGSFQEQGGPHVDAVGGTHVGNSA